jgi:isoamylase
MALAQQTDLVVTSGDAFPQGAHATARGTNFSLWSEGAEGVELCLFDDDGAETRIALRERTASQWHCFVEGVGPGQRYGYRVHGAYDPVRGLRFNPDKLLLDPYALAIDGTVDWHGPTLLPYVIGEEGDDTRRDDADSAPAMPKSVVAERGYDWEGDEHPRHRWSETIIYEAHVKGLTMTHPGVPEELRGTYAGLAHPAIVDHLVGLGVTAIELLPVHHFVEESFLVDEGLTNYWGYSSIGFLAPHGPYSSAGTRGEQVREFKDMVKALHAAGLEVIMDVVYNHTAEGNHLGPMLSFKGIDNLAYYRQTPDDPRFFMDYTGTGNSLDPTHPQVLRLIMDSLRYFAVECHVDGFRFDLAAALARGLHEADRLSGFLDTIHQDPVLSQVKLIAEPWDVGPGGYQVGNFPALWSEWNGEYRDDVRDFWRGELSLAAFAQRFAGSADLYAEDGRRPRASINFITAHDGFTLRDLVSYNDKHNEANKEDNQDGADDNRSWNCGAEGETDDPEILALRARQQRNLLATLVLSQGVPMILGGDESGRTQGGSNNAWCQDNEISWLDWASPDEELLTFTKRLVALRAAEPVFRRRDFLTGDERRDSGHPDVVWMRPDGPAMEDGDWDRDDARALGVFLNGEELPSGKGDSFIILFNAHHEGVEFTIDPALGSHWTLELASDDEHDDASVAEGGSMILPGRSLRILRRARR